MAKIVILPTNLDIEETTIRNIIVSTFNGVRKVEVIKTTTGDIVAHVKTANVFTSYRRLKEVDAQFAMRGIEITDIEVSPIAASQKHELSYAIYFTNINLI